jgi:hypothetical protein
MSIAHIIIGIIAITWIGSTTAVLIGINRLIKSFDAYMDDDYLLAENCGDAECVTCILTKSSYPDF